MSVGRVDDWLGGWMWWAEQRLMLRGPAARPLADTLARLCLPALSMCDRPLRPRPPSRQFEYDVGTLAAAAAVEARRVEAATALREAAAAIAAGAALDGKAAPPASAAKPLQHEALHLALLKYKVQVRGVGMGMGWCARNGEAVTLGKPAGVPCSCSRLHAPGALP